ncbi:class I SAM-dependent methyltransferase [Streptomyces roseifaciens]|uniref:class I SAM-dependent methyltransferase n=1 Tax=Streptomyces roseifaciens TaxID=1488406 RepID=UPI0007182554|nr:class I SAM-dependent methyltransferase [Streptomyces roseifaciens]
MDDAARNEQAWTAYGKHHLERGTHLSEPERLDWGFWGTGPGAEVLGDLAGKRTLDIGPGTGRYPAYLARTHEAVVDAVEASPTQYLRATARYRDVPGVRFVQADAVDFLRRETTPVYDVAYSVHGLGYIDPHQFLDALAPRVREGGSLVFSVLHTNSDGVGPEVTLVPRDETLPLAGGGELTVRMWVLSPVLWEDLLVEAGFLVDHITVLQAPEPSNPVACTLFAARRR